MLKRQSTSLVRIDNCEKILLSQLRDTAYWDHFDWDSGETRREKREVMTMLKVDYQNEEEIVYKPAIVFHQRDKTYSIRQYDTVEEAQREYNMILSMIGHDKIYQVYDNEQ